MEGGMPGGREERYGLMEQRERDAGRGGGRRTERKRDTVRAKKTNLSQ